MPNTREKLIELQLQADIEDNISENTTQHREFTADLMIAHGVTVQNRDIHWATEQAYKNGYEKGRQDAMKWIPVSERLPEDNQDVLGYMQNSIESRIFPASYYKGRWEDCIWNTQCLSVTHWMPLPEPPKGE